MNWLMTKKSTNFVQELPHLLYTQSHALSIIRKKAAMQSQKKKKVGTDTRMPAFKSNPFITTCDFGQVTPSLLAYVSLSVKWELTTNSMGYLTF